MLDPRSYLLLLLATIAVELLFALAFAPRDRRRDVASVCVALNMVSHPLATMAAVALAPAFVPVELAVAFGEAWGYAVFARLSLPRAALLAVVANGVTVFASVIGAMAG